MSCSKARSSQTTLSSFRVQFLVYSSRVQVLARQVKVLGEARLCYEYKWTRPTLAVARNSQTIIANLPKYAVHGRGATKSPAPVSPRTYIPLA